ncbi:MAG: hypothetical protein KatS3mg129_2644 [Leptospiraceae bacterium]|nr:MAG: hypothetical protein KatS3mg129_2644 [Leptospiraceae bacterium]
MSFISKVAERLKLNTFDFKILSNYLFYILIFVLILLNLYDIIYHLIYDGFLNLHQTIEAILLLFITILVFSVKIYNSYGIENLYHKITEKEEEVSLYKEKYRNSIKQIKKGIEEQFDYWKLTKSEKKIAQYLILGYSFKQIAGILNKSEKTIRNQSLNIYKKSGMTSRHDLAGFFLYDFFDED